MDNEDGDFEHLKINVNENEGNGNEINESEKCGKSKRKKNCKLRNTCQKERRCMQYGRKGSKCKKI